jgi:hypothetical protein
MSTRSRSAPRRQALDAQVVEWRREQLLAAGFAPALAVEVAAEGRLDLHALIELVERGCEPRLAVRILAPLDDDQGQTRR